MGSEVRIALQGLLRRVGELRMGMEHVPQTPLQTPTPTSPASGFNWGRRRSSAKVLAAGT